MIHLKEGSWNSELGKLHSTLRLLMRELPASSNQLRRTIDTVLAFLGEEDIKLAYPVYSQGDWYDEVLVKAVDYLFRSCENSRDWRSALDDFEGANSVPLMTIHKSKGLEYHTVVFLALDDEAWWSFSKAPRGGQIHFLRRVLES